MAIDRATVWCLVAALLVAGACREPGSNSPESAGQHLADEPLPGETNTGPFLDEISRPEGPPKTSEELAQHIQYSIQEQDKEMLASLFYRIESEGYKLQHDDIDNSVDSILSTREQNLIGIVAAALSEDEISKRDALTKKFNPGRSVKLVPYAKHAIRFQYRGRLEIGRKSRPTLVYAGQHDGVYYIATLQVGVEETGKD